MHINFLYSDQELKRLLKLKGVDKYAFTDYFVVIEWQAMISAQKVILILLVPPQHRIGKTESY